MKDRMKRSNEIEEKVETNNEKKSKVRKISTAVDFIASTRARLSEVSSEVKSKPIGPYHRKKSRYFFFVFTFLYESTRIKLFFILK